MAEAVPRFCVLGGGLSGLTSAFLLQRSLPLARIQVVERTQRCGGHAASALGARGQVLEQGFHASILNSRSGREALGLARLLRLDDEVLSAEIEVPHILRYGPALLAEPLWPRRALEDESVYAFIARRASSAVADRLADPICRGQLAGDARLLSVRTCFPRLWFNERRFGSIFVGAFFSAFSAYRQRSWLSLDLFDPLLQRVSTGGRCYSFRKGLGALTARLEEALQDPPLGTRPVEILKGATVARLRSLQSSARSSAEVDLSDGRTLGADAVIASVPPYELARILESSGLDAPSADLTLGKSICQILASILHESVAVVNVGFDTNVLKGRFRGAGYFAGSLEQQAILGMSWDSMLFPGQDPQPGMTRLTVYIGGQQCSSGSEAEMQATAMQAVRGHLGIHENPREVHTNIWPNSIPQYAVGHHHLMRALNAARVEHLPWLQVAGAGYFGTRSAADEIVDARKLVDSLGSRFARFPNLVENETEEDVAWRYGAGFDAD